MKGTTDGSTLVREGYTNRDVEVLASPVTERYCKPPCIGLVEDGQIRVGGAWFALDMRWTVRPLETRNGLPVGNR